MIPIEWYLALAGLIFSMGAISVLVNRNLISCPDFFRSYCLQE